jgi:hypothetical protein
MLKYQYHLIARCDDLGNFRTHDLHGHNDPRYSHFALQTKVHWSKNVMEERDCPEQIFLGSYDHDYCLLLSLSIYLETYLSNVGTNSVYLFGEGIESDATVNRIKSTFSSSLRKFFVDYCRDSAAVLGTHSFRKYAATWARNNGCTEDDVNNRGRWKRTRRVVDRYLDVLQEYVDAKVQAALCVGGPIRYKLVEGSGISIDWYLENVVPSIRAYYSSDNTICHVLALPLLYACLHPDLMDTVPLTIALPIQQAYERVRVLDTDVNPVKRFHLSITRSQDKLCIDEVEMIEIDGERQQQQEQQQDPNNNIILIQMQQLKQQIATQYDQLQQSVMNLRSEISDKHQIIQRNINRIFIQPPRQATRQQRQERENDQNNNIDLAEENPPQLIAALSKTPRTLFDLWIEYTTGIGGNKPAKDFTFVERGKCKFKYCRRKVVWDCISAFVNAGHLSAVAIDRIYQAYGRNQTVSSIINAMIQDRKRGGHPNLRL